LPEERKRERRCLFQCEGSCRSLSPRARSQAKSKAASKAEDGIKASSDEPQWQRNSGDTSSGKGRSERKSDSTRSLCRWYGASMSLAQWQ